MSRLFQYIPLMGVVLLSTCMAVLGEMPFEPIAPLVANTNPCAEIRNAEFVCIDCSVLAYCVQENGQWKTVQHEECPTRNSLFCNAEQRSCTVQPSCRIPPGGIKFDCQMPGQYPDPYECKVYHSCNANNEHTRYVCPPDTAYNVQTKSCTLSALHGDSCKKAQFKCESVGAVHAWPGDENIYYICHPAVSGEPYPVFYHCPKDRVFNSNECVLRSTSSGTSSSSSATGASGSSTAGNQAECIEGRLTPNYTDCRSYYTCSKGNLRSIECPPGTYYNRDASSCVLGTCQN